LVLTCGLIAGGGYLINKELLSNSVKASQPKVTSERSQESRIETIHPKKMTAERTTTQPGSIYAFESVQLYPGVTGYLKTLHVDIGDRIKKGQVLAKVDVPELEKQVERCASTIDQANARVIQMKARVVSAKAELDAVKASVPQAEAVAKSKSAELRFRQKQLERMRDLFATNSIDERTVDEKIELRDAAREAEIAANEMVTSVKAKVVATAAKIQQAEADVQEAEAEVKVAKAEHEKAQVLVQFATITAPFDGIVTERNFFPGDFVRAATESESRGPLLTVQRTDLMRVVVQVPDRDVPYCEPGEQATVEVDALPGNYFPAKVSRVARSEDKETRLMRVEIDLPNVSGKICNGMYGRVTILLAKQEVLTIPSSCLTGKPQEGKSSVFVVINGKAHSTPVMLSNDNGSQVTVLSGLSASDQVILHANRLTEGTPVSGKSVEVSSNIH
jgi:RND family efflux transporter MFP subunit